MRAAGMSKRIVSTSVGLAAITACLALVGTASANRSPQAANGAKRLTTVRIMVVPSFDAAAIFLGAKHGFFKKRGIALKGVPVASGPAGIALLQSGAADLGLIAFPPLLVAASNRVPLKIVSVTSIEENRRTPGTSYTELIARPDRGITNWRSLEGKTIGVFSLTSNDAICTKLSVAKAGGDPSKVRFLEVPSGSLGVALDQGQVDAAVLTDPFRTQYLNGTRPRVVGDPCGYTMPKNAPRIMLFTTQQIAAEKQQLLRNFAAATKESLAFATKHLGSLRSTLARYSTIPPDIVQKMAKPAFGSSWNVRAAAAIVQLLLDNNVLRSSPDLDALAPISP